MELKQKLVRTAQDTALSKFQFPFGCEFHCCSADSTLVTGSCTKHESKDEEIVDGCLAQSGARWNSVNLAAVNKSNSTPLASEQKQNNSSVQNCLNAITSCGEETTVLSCLPQTQVAEVKLEANFVDDLGADSLDIVELVMAVEEEFGEENAQLFPLMCDSVGKKPAIVAAIILYF